MSTDGMHEEVPDIARSALRRFDDQLAEVRTHRIRFGNLPLPGGAGPERSPATEAAALRAAAESADAPIELVRIARAVRAGRTTYEAIAAGAADGIPEVAAARAAAEARFHDMVAAGTVRLVLDHGAGQPEPDRPAPTPDDDEPPESFMVRPARRRP